MIVPVLLFLTTLSYIQCGCPIKCKCDENSVTCISNNLKQVPYFESLDEDPIIIDLSGNEIDIINTDDFSFDKSDQVVEIYLNSSKVIHIEEKSFDELPNLQELYLAENLLNTLGEDFIANNENMILLDISNNYFVEMPKINSPSLEVLAIANSGISRVGNDVLSGLPNLRVLLLQQNNLKAVNPVIFHNMPNFFFVRLAYNPWQCNCRTVQLFNYLTEKKIADITEPVQCQTESKVFIDMYNSKGVTAIFKQQCTEAALDSGDYEDYEEYNDGVDLEDMLKQMQPSNPTSDVKCKSKCDDGMEIDGFYFTNFYYSSLLCSAIVVSLIVGAALGSGMTYFLLKRRMRQTERWNKLLSKSDDDFS